VPLRGARCRYSDAAAVAVISEPAGCLARVGAETTCGAGTCNRQYGRRFSGFTDTADASLPGNIGVVIHANQASFRRQDPAYALLRTGTLSAGSCCIAMVGVAGIASADDGVSWVLYNSSGASLTVGTAQVMSGSLTSQPSAGSTIPNGGSATWVASDGTTTFNATASTSQQPVDAAGVNWTISGYGLSSITCIPKFSCSTYGYSAYVNPTDTTSVTAAAAVAAVPSYAITRGAILGADVAAVAADAVAVVTTEVTAAIATVLSGLPLSATAQAPSVQTVVARFTTDVTKLQTDWQETFSAANFVNYVQGLQSAPAPAPSSAAVSVPSRRSAPAKAIAKPAATRVAIVSGQSSAPQAGAPTVNDQAVVVVHRAARDSPRKPQPRA